MISWKIAFRSVFRKPSQNFSVLMGIALGVSLFAGVQIGSDSLAKGFVTFGVHSLGDVDASVTNQVAPFFVTNQTLTEELYNGSAAPDIYQVLNSAGNYQQYTQSYTTRLELSTTVIDENTGSTEISKSLVGISPSETGFGALYNENGKQLNIGDLQPNEIYMGKSLADLVFENINPIGRTVSVITQLQSLSLPLPGLENSYKVPVVLNLKIVDVFQDKGLGREKYSDFMVAPLGWLQEQFVQAFQTARTENPSEVIVGFGSHPISSVLINWNSDVNSKSKGEVALNAFQQHFIDVFGVQTAAFYSFSNDRQNIEDSFTSAVDQINLILNVFGYIIMLAGVLVIVNIQMMALSSREKETGILRAVGAKRYQIIVSNLAEALLVGIFGSLVGLIGGILYGRILLFFMGTAFGFPSSDIPTVVTRTSLNSAFIAGFLLSQLTGILPAIMASRINVAQVLRGLTTPPDAKFGKKTLYFGIIFTGLAILNVLSLDPNPLIDGKKAFYDLGDVEASYLPISMLIMGPSLLYSYYGSKRGGLTLFSVGLLAWGNFNIFVVFDWLKTGNGGLLYVLYLILTLVGGSIILFGMNLKYISLLGEKLTAFFVKNRKSPIRGTSMVAFRKMTSKPTRSTLTFALFATILTLNIFMATWSYSFRYGYDQVVVEVSSGSDILLYTRDNPIDNSINFPQLVVNQFKDASTSIEFMKPFTLSEKIVKVNLNDGKHKEPWETLLATMPNGSLLDSNGQYDLKFNLADNKTGAVLADGTPLETMTTPDNGPAFTAEDANVWTLFNANRTLLNKNGEPRPMILTTFIYASDGFNFVQTHYPGDSVFLNLTNGKQQEFVIGSLMGSNPIVDFTSFGYEGPPIFPSVWFLDQYWASQIQGIADLNNRSNVFLGKTSESDIKSSKIDNLIRDIEIWANQKDGAFRQAHGLYGVVGIPVYDIYEVQLEGQYRFFQFLQAFVSLGFVVGILGLLVVASRSVAERKREIGMLRALGFRGQDVVVSVVLELVVMSIIGLFIGFINGSILGYALTNINSGGEATFLIPWPIIGFYLFITVFSALVAAVIPAMRAAKIPPSDALRYTG